MNINTVNSTTFTNARNINNTILKTLNSKVSAMYIIWSSSYIRMQLLYTDINELIFHTVYVPCANTICIQAYIYTHTHECVYGTLTFSRLHILNAICILVYVMVVVVVVVGECI
nr:hypothetical protein NNONMNKP_00134 [Oryctes rhinoceros nudivirus]